MIVVESFFCPAWHKYWLETSRRWRFLLTTWHRHTGSRRIRHALPKHALLIPGKLLCRLELLFSLSWNWGIRSSSAGLEGCWSHVPEVIDALEREFVHDDLAFVSWTYFIIGMELSCTKLEDITITTLNHIAACCVRCYRFRLSHFSNSFTVFYSLIHESVGADATIIRGIGVMYSQAFLHPKAKNRTSCFKFFLWVNSSVFSKSSLAWFIISAQNSSYDSTK